MTSYKSIDGLQRRSGKKVAKKQIVAKPEKAKISSGKKAEKSLKIREEIEFLNSIRDADPTDLVEIAPKKEAKKTKKIKEKKQKVKKKGGKKKILKRILIVFVLLLLVLGGVVYFFLDDIIGKITDNGNVIGFLFSDSDAPLETDENGRTNVLVFGTEGYDMNEPNYDGGHLTDSMMVLSFDQETGDIKAVSMPRDLKTETCTATGKINELFWCEYQKTDGSDEQNKQYEEAGAKALENAFEEVLGLQIQYRVHLNWAALIQAVDALGGIDVVFVYEDQTWDGDETTIPTTDRRGLADGDGYKLFYNYKNGEVIHLDGESALAVARTRNAYSGWGASGGNFSREIFQQKIIEALVKKAKQTGLDLGKLIGIKDAIGDNVRTNFKDTELKTLIRLSNTLNINSIESLSLVSPADGTAPLMTTGMINGISYVYPTAGVTNYTKIHQYLTKKLSDGFESEEAEISVLNATETYGLASNEQLDLEDAGFNVIVTDNAPDSIAEFDGVRVYQVNKDMSKTAAELEKRYGVSVKTKIPESLQEIKGDFIIVLGNRE